MDQGEVCEFVRGRRWVWGAVGSAGAAAERVGVGGGGLGGYLLGLRITAQAHPLQDFSSFLFV